MRTEAEINEQIDAATESSNEFGSQWPGMTYEEGVTAALYWALGQTDEAPMTTDEA